jgi:hypothetical protein
MKAIFPALGLVVAAGCKTIDGTTGFPPFYEVYPTPSSLVDEPGREVLVRPLYALESLESGSRRIRSFPPFIRLFHEDDDTDYRILPLFYYRDYQQPLGGRDVDWFLLPFFGGSDPEEGGYFAVFPLGGRIKGLLAHNESTFVLFPLYWHWRTGARESLHVLWPFYNRVSGGDWSGSRLWPFWGRYRSRTRDDALRYDRGFVFWPFWIRGRDQLHIEPTESFFTFPFYGYRVNRLADTRTCFWPFYQRHHDKRTGRVIHMGYLIPWRVTDGQTDIWPLFGFKRTERQISMAGELRHRRRHYVLWPIERYDWAADADEEMTRFWLLPLLWHFHYIDRKSLQERTVWKVWPLFDYRSEPGKVAFDILAPLWLQREEYDRFYTRWFAIVRYRKRPEVSGWEVLYGAVSYRRERLEPVPDGAIEAGEEALFSVLGGLFECGRRRDELVLRLLYVPWW